ncbi:Uma2 family endonuclease [Allokutzneria multivorans]|uniref:Uma2 family endonuclease n=1 Tax=Allokutzneria multivorans TaxID=1142134 RepID=A0ABP7RHF6_9PSEU
MDDEDQREAVNEMSSAVQLGPYTLDDWLNLEPVEGYRVELVDGHYVMSPAPAMLHNYVADELRVVLQNAVKWLGLVAVTGINVRVGDRGYIPDVAVCGLTDSVVTPAEEILLAVEVMSPSTVRADRLEKPAAYAAAGIPRYWRVEFSTARTPTIFCYELDGGSYRQVAFADGTATAEVSVTDEVVVKLIVHDILPPERRSR